MEISQLLTYPIKGMRAVSLSQSTVTKNGFPFDRRFMLHKITRDDSSPNGFTMKKMQVDSFPELCLFHPELDIPDPEDLRSARIIVTFRPPGDRPTKTIEIPLRPDIAGLRQVEIVLHKSPTLAYDMGPKYNDWLESCFGFEAMLAYLGPHLREVYCSNPANVRSGNSWLSSITANIPLLGAGANLKDEITFADCVPYLVVSETSLRDVSRRLPDGEEMDITKFRPNIVVKGAPEEWEEDFWAELLLGNTRVITAHNCARCMSINVDYATGKFGTGESGNVLKKLMKDRRVDTAMKYSPIFGRYSFLHSGDHGNIIRVGDEVTVLKRNAERSKFDWKGLTES